MNEVFNTKAEAFAWLGQNPGRVVRSSGCSEVFHYSDNEGLMIGYPGQTTAEQNDRAWSNAKAPFKVVDVAIPRATDAEIAAYFERLADQDDLRDRDELWRRAARIVRTRRLP